jgi:hypothetical protein
MSDVKKWAVYSACPPDRDFEFTGTEQELWAHFKSKYICGHCKHEMETGEMCVVGTGGTEDVLYFEPYADPFASPCGYEFTYEEITTEPQATADRLTGDTH